MKSKIKEELFVASQWELIRLKFTRHKLAMGALGVLLVFYFFTIFAEFTSPYDPRAYDRDKLFCPPQRLHFFDEYGNFSFRPFVYQVALQINPNTLREDYVVSKTRKIPLYFFFLRDMLISCGDYLRVTYIFSGLKRKRYFSLEQIEWVGICYLVSYMGDGYLYQ